MTRYKIYAKIKTTFSATHQWKKCNIEEVKFLKHEHFHQFYVTVYIEQFHCNRDIEYIAFKKWLDKKLSKYNYKSIGQMSCEDIAIDIKQMIEKKYPSRDVIVEVNEDEQRGAVVQNQINVNDLSWLAGFIDGEGSFTIAKQKRKDHYVYFFCFSIANTNLKAIKKCQRIIKEHINVVPRIYTYKRKNRNWKTTYYLQLASQKEIYLLCSLIRPYLCNKKKHVEVIMKALETQFKHNSKYKDSHKRFYSKRFLYWYNKIKALNKLGDK